MNSVTRTTMFVPRIALVIIVSLTFGVAHSQSTITEIDSLKSVIDDSKQHDTNRIKAQMALANRLLNSSLDSTIMLFQKSIDLINSSLKKHDYSEEQRKKLKEDLAKSHNRLGFCLYRSGDIPNCIKSFQNSLTVSEKNKDTSNMAFAYVNLGGIYLQQEQYESSLEYLHKALPIFEKQEQHNGLATTLRNIGGIYSKTDRDSLTIKYYLRALKIEEENNLKPGLSSSYANIGNYYLRHHDTTKAFEYTQKALDIAYEINKPDKMFLAHLALGKIFFWQEKYTEAKSHAAKSLELAEKMSVAQYQRDAYNFMAAVYRIEGNWKSAYEYYKTYINLRDSINNAELDKAAMEQKLSFEYNRKAELDSLKAAEQKKLTDAQLKTAELREKQSEQRKLTLYVALALAMMIGAFIFNRLRITRKQRDIINLQKKEVETQKNKVDQAYETLEEKNREILDSINYAKRIQSAILPSTQLMEETLPEHFIYYKPKDIVAGDFYWVKSIGDEVWFAVADCTGHGVPGAMVSVVCANALNKVVMESRVSAPGKILDQVTDIVISQFSEGNEDMKDGMDIALCRLNKGTGELTYAGANNSLYLVSNGELSEIKATKQPVGQYINRVEFISHQIELKGPSNIYLFSDGFADQFGGEKGKKFKYASFKKLLVAQSDSPLTEQKEILAREFTVWKKDYEQIDDVCVMGVRLKPIK